MKKELFIPFKEETQLITAHYGNGENHQIIVPPQLQLNQGMFLPDHIIEQEEFHPNYGLVCFYLIISLNRRNFTLIMV